ncbi:MAG: proline dehydrogenase family protein [Salibacteraceae bacterium]
MATQGKKESKVSFDNTEIAFSHLTDKELDFSITMFKLMQNPTLVQVGTSLSNLALALRLPISPIVKATVFKQFCGGVDLNESLKKVKELSHSKIGSILDYAVEGAESEKIFDDTKEQIIEVINKAETTDGIPVACMKITGIARFALLEKVTAREPLSEKEKLEYLAAIDRFEEICKASYKTGVPIYVDAEETWIQPAIDKLVESRMRVYNKEKAIVFQTLQMYRWDKIDHLKKLLAESKKEGWILGVKFVRGAYMEKENKRALDMGYKTLIQPNKAATDHDFDLAIKMMVENIDHVEICNGTHNALSSMKLVNLMLEYNLENNDRRIYFSQLKGMSDTISFNLADAGYNVSKYLPYGPVKATMPYLTRRAEENSAIAGQMGKELTDLLIEKERRNHQRQLK